MLPFNTLFPVFTLIILGAVFRRIGFTNTEFLKASDRLVYFLLFPVLLFWKIGGASGRSGMDNSLFTAAILTVLTVYLISLLSIRLFGITSFGAGAFSQCTYRFNTYIGMAVVLNALGEEGVRTFSLLIAFIIPLINVLAVSTLIWFSGDPIPLRQKTVISLRAIMLNPLILSCIAGILYASFGPPFPVFLENTFSLLSTATLPLALFSIGGALGSAHLKDHFMPAVLACCHKHISFPLIGIGFLSLLGVSGLSRDVGLIFFALPTSTAAYVLCSQLGSDAELASAIVFLSTIVSFVPLTLVLL